MVFTNALPIAAVALGLGVMPLKFKTGAGIAAAGLAAAFCGNMNYLSPGVKPLFIATTAVGVALMSKTGLAIAAGGLLILAVNGLYNYLRTPTPARHVQALDLNTPPPGMPAIN